MATFRGTAGVDVFSGAADTNSIYMFNVGELTSQDRVRGSSLLSALDRLSILNSGTITALDLQGVEQLEQVLLALGGNTITISANLARESSTGSLRIIDQDGSSNITILSDSSGVVLIDIGGGNDRVVGGAGNETVRATAANLTSADVFIGGSGVDRLIITGGGVIPLAALAGMSGIEIVHMQNGGTLTLGDGFFGSSALVQGNGGNDIVDASAITTTGVRFMTGTGNDSIVGTDQTDIVIFKGAELTGGDAADAGLGVDRLEIDGGTVGGGSLANMENFERIRLMNSVNLTLSDGDLNGAPVVQVFSGNNRVDASGLVTSNLMFDGSNGNETVLGGAGDDTVRMTAAQLSASDTFTGGEGSDTLRITGGGAVASGQLAGVSGIERVQLIDGGSVELRDGMFSGRGYALGGTANDAFDASAITTQGVTFNTGTGTDTVRGSQQDDQFSFNTAGALDATDIVEGNAGYDTVSLDGVTTAANAMLGVSEIERVMVRNGASATLLDTMASTSIQVLAVSGNNNVDGSGLTTLRVFATTGTGADSISGGAASDIFTLSNNSFGSIDGNTGFDFAKVDATGAVLDMASWVGRMSDIEVVDMRGTTVNELLVTEAAVISVAQDNAIYVVGSDTDEVTFDGGWVIMATGVTHADLPGLTFTEYAKGSVSVFVDGTIPPGGISGVSLPSAPVVDLNGSDPLLTYGTKYTTGTGPIAIAETDLTITDTDGLHKITAMNLTMTGGGAGDEIKLSAAGTIMAANNGLTVTSSRTSIVITGSATRDVYEDLLTLIQFENAQITGVVDSGDRVITITVTDTLGDVSTPVTSTIDVTRANTDPTPVVSR